MKTIEDVRAFWDAKPLFTDTVEAQTGSREFFDEHTRVALAMYGGRAPIEFLPICEKEAPILSLGCGIGFWPPWYWQHGFRNIRAADISPNSLDLAKQRCELYGVRARFDIQNAESMTYPDDTFAHIECNGVIHHSPNPQASINEMYRVLKPGGRAVITVYYLNALHRMWPIIRPAAMLVSSLGVKLTGRGRESMLSATTTSELVRLYDGAENPIGLAFSRKEFLAMFGKWRHKQTFYCSFPAQVLPVRLPHSVIRTVTWATPFLIGAVVEKPH